MKGIYITEAMLKKHATNVRHKDPKSTEFLLKISHLSLNNKKICSMQGLYMCRNLKVLYLNENKLIKIEGLDACDKLTQLDLQDNFLTKIEGLENCLNL